MPSLSIMTSALRATKKHMQSATSSDRRPVRSLLTTLRATAALLTVQTDIEVEILKLKWTSHVHPLKLFDFETIARRLRYRALATACLAQDIRLLLLGHHADDQAETVLSRIIAGYHGAGLAGMQSTASIPECEGVYGAAQSGTPRRVDLVPLKGIGMEERTASIEHGGIEVMRPLLGFTKAELRATCVANGLRWAEDRTNADPTLGPRNAIRYLLKDQRLPAALRTGPVLELARGRREKWKQLSEGTERIFDECKVDVNPLVGTVDVRFPANIRELLLGKASVVGALVDARCRAAMLVRRIALLVSPLSTIRLMDCRVPAQMLFPYFLSGNEEHDIETNSAATVGKTLIRIMSPAIESTKADRSHGLRCLVSRTPPTAQDRQDQLKTLLIETTERAESTEWSETDRTLFDGRFWIKLRYRQFNHSPGHRISIRFLEQQDIDSIQKDKTNPTAWLHLRQILKDSAPGKIRFTLPAIVSTNYVNAAGGKQRLKTRLLALPTLRWSSVGWVEYDKKNFQEAWQWTIRYKKVEFKAGIRHSFVG